VPPDLDEAFEVRLSLCCGRPGCRRRVLPPSVLFWGRRVYPAPVVLLVSALRQGRGAVPTMARLKALFGMWPSTLVRWRRYFQDLFVQSLPWRRLSGQLLPPLCPQQLPAGLIERFDHGRGQPELALAACLQALAPGP